MKLKIPVHIVVETMRKTYPHLFNGSHKRLMESMNMFTEQQIEDTIERKKVEAFAEVERILMAATPMIASDTLTLGRKYICASTNKGLVNRERVLTVLTELGDDIMSGWD